MKKMNRDLMKSLRLLKKKISPTTNIVFMPCNPSYCPIAHAYEVNAEAWYALSDDDKKTLVNRGWTKKSYMTFIVWFDKLGESPSDTTAKFLKVLKEVK